PLIDGINKAERRIGLAALYIGHNEVGLQQALASKLATNTNVKLHIVVDAMRGSRITDRSTQASTVSLLAPLKQRFDSQTTISLFQLAPSNNPIRNLVPQRFNEAFALQHVKVYVFDDDVVVSGANLSNDYFSNRQDRYILIKNNKQVADYFSNLLTVMGNHSHTVTSHKEQSLQIQRNTCTLSQMSEAFKTFERDSLQKLPPTCLEDAANPSPSISSLENLPPSFDTIITPILQCGPLGIHTETNFLAALLKNLQKSSASSTVTCSSAYFNLPEKLQPLILNNHNNSTNSSSPSKFSFLLAAPEANGFFNSRGVSRHLPFAYTFLAARFWDKVRQVPGGTNRIEMREYKRDGWTFHAKGTYPTSYSCIQHTTTNTHPHWTLIGSSNYGYRSYTRDLEAQVVIQTKNKRLQKRRLQSYSNRVDDSNFGSVERKPNVWVRVATRIIKTML
ncbi:hypothetical protein BDR26DRAFT_868809, partial [Obelidium mucronatum]